MLTHIYNPSYPEMVTRRIVVQSHLRQKVSETQSQPIIWAWWHRLVIPVMWEI
jgi:hypothetical protein